jgi:hypothetical protein
VRDWFFRRGRMCVCECVVLCPEVRRPKGVPGHSDVTGPSWDELTRFKSSGKYIAVILVAAKCEER